MGYFKCVAIQGGLGNQMFQYAFLRALSVRQLCGVCMGTYEIMRDKNHNGYELERVFGIKENFIERKLRLLYSKNKYKKRVFAICSEKVDFKYDSDVFRFKANRIINYYHGYWQNESYFKGIEGDLRNIFVFDESQFSPRTAEIAIQILSQKNSVSVHIRRGDYYDNPVANKVHGGICEVDYYRRAIEQVRNSLGDVSLYVFSDEPEWVKSNMPFLADCQYIDWNGGETSWQDMALMSKCAHHIIANSTFSWWGAWLSAPSSSKVVIAPSRWWNLSESTDILPDRWIKI